MEKKNTGLIVLVVVLSLLVVGLGGYIVYDKILNNDVSDNGNADNIKDDDSHTYNFSVMEGYYFKQENDTNGESSYGLYLLANGMFKIRYAGMSPYGYIGNYTIENDILTLNYWFKFNSGTGWSLTNDVRKVKIKSLNSLELKEQNNLIILEKNDKVDDSIKDFDFYNDFKSNKCGENMYCLY